MLLPLFVALGALTFDGDSYVRAQEPPRAEDVIGDGTCTSGRHQGSSSATPQADSAGRSTPAATVATSSPRVDHRRPLLPPAHRYRSTALTGHLPDWITARIVRAPDPIETPKPTGDLRDASAYAMAALTGELDKLLAATEGCRNDTLNAAAFALGQLVGAGDLHHGTVHDELVSAARRIGLPRTEAERTIASGMAAGVREPRRYRPQPT
jgi:hypothetical protein